MEIRLKLKIQLSEVLNTSEAEVEALTYGDESWDSLAHMNVIAMLEENYGFDLDEEEMIEITSLDAIETLVSQKARK